MLNEVVGFEVGEERDGAFVIRGYSYPLTDGVPGHPGVCLLAEARLT